MTNSHTFDASSFADGANESIIVDGATVGGTFSNLGGLTNGTTATFTLNSVVYDASVTVNLTNTTVTITGDGGSELASTSAEALLDAIRYNNTSSDPTTGSNRVLAIRAFDGDGALYFG